MEELSDAINWFELRFGGKLHLTNKWWMRNWFGELEFVWINGGKQESIPTSTVLTAYEQSKSLSV